MIMSLKNGYSPVMQSGKGPQYCGARFLPDLTETALVVVPSIWGVWVLAVVEKEIGTALAFTALVIASVYYRWDGYDAENRLWSTSQDSYRSASDSGILFGCLLAPLAGISCLFSIPKNKLQLNAYVTVLIQLSLVFGFILIGHARSMRLKRNGCGPLQIRFEGAIIAATILIASSWLGVRIGMPTLLGPLTIGVYQAFLSMLNHLLPRSFTFGELAIVVHGITIAVVDAVYVTLLTLNPTGAESDMKSSPDRGQLSSVLRSHQSIAPTHVLGLAVALGMGFIGIATLPILRRAKRAAMALGPLASTPTAASFRNGRKMQTPEGNKKKNDDNLTVSRAGPKRITDQVKASITFAIMAASIVIAIIDPWVMWVTGHEGFVMTLNFLMDPLHPKRLYLGVYWTVTLAVTLILLTKYHPPLEKLHREHRKEGERKIGKNTPMISLNTRRKAFHALAVGMFVPGFLIESEFMRLALAVAFALLLLVEYVRGFCLFPPMGANLNEFLSEFLDRRDKGCEAIMAHMYLLIGCAVPMWISGENLIAGLSGVLVLGIGDSVASVIGKLVGRHRWPGTSKTMEGTLAFILLLILAGCSLAKFTGGADSSGYLDPLSHVVKYSLACTAAGMLEAVSAQNDNVVLPLYFYIVYLALLGTVEEVR